MASETLSQDSWLFRVLMDKSPAFERLLNNGSFAVLVSHGVFWGDWEYRFEFMDKPFARREHGVGGFIIHPDVVEAAARHLEAGGFE